MESISHSGGVERESEGKRGCAGGDVKMVARLEVGEVVVEGQVGLGIADKAAGAREGSSDPGSAEARCPGAQGKNGGAEKANGQVLGHQPIVSLQVGRGVNEINEGTGEVHEGSRDGLVSDSHGKR